MLGATTACTGTSIDGSVSSDCVGIPGILGSPFGSGNSIAGSPGGGLITDYAKALLYVVCFGLLAGGLVKQGFKRIL